MNVKKESIQELAKEVLNLLKPSRQVSLEKVLGGPRFPSETLRQTFPQELAAPASATIIALRGELGAGKTTFTQALACELGIEDTIQSPTYVLMKSYPIDFKGFKKLIHIDAYRLEKPEEFTALEPETFLNDPTNLVVLEWPERVEGVLPTPDIVLNFSHTDSEEERHIEIEK